LIGFSHIKKVSGFNSYAKMLWLKPDKYRTCFFSCLKATGIDEKKSIAVHFSELTKENKNLIGFSHIKRICFQ
jgi:DUF438 domain-containing protein